ncbi:hypothetical protein [Methylohalobius crimeensis]|uniref:hypothetical protein n=1 Tax=Methylohalobius crimeensis TaxID=244365 RepID=UPI0003B70A51|nr:hypothetical protein [Methylohalobius crimeensis]
MAILDHLSSKCRSAAPRIKSARGPTLAFPVLIIESDDWGPGSDEEARALDAVRAL